MALPRYIPLNIEVGGRRYSGDWHVEGKTLHVSSAYGSASAPLGRAKPENVAARLLREIVEARHV